MNIKVGQWLRHKNNIHRLVGYCDCSSCKERGFEEPILQGTENEYITTEKWWLEYVGESNVANTPQELIEVGDMIILKGYWDEPLLVSFIDKQGHPHATVRTSSGSESTDLMKWYNCDKIIKILTPNGKDYICQWESE